MARNISGAITAVDPVFHVDPLELAAVDAALQDALDQLMAGLHHLVLENAAQSPGSCAPRSSSVW